MTFKRKRLDKNNGPTVKKNEKNDFFGDLSDEEPLNQKRKKINGDHRVNKVINPARKIEPQTSTEVKEEHRSDRDFFADLQTDDEDAKCVKYYGSFKSKTPQNTPAWVKGTGIHLQKFVKMKDLVDIESVIVDYLKKNKIEVIDGIVAELRAAEVSNASTNLRLRISEEKRMKRLCQKREKTSKEDESDEYFKNSQALQGPETFEEMSLHKKLMKAITLLKYQRPTAIQSAAIPKALAGKDICGCAATGTGKTAAYALPILERLLQCDRSGERVIRVLVLLPTRELGVQVFQVFHALAKFTSIKIGLVCGGLSGRAQMDVLRGKPDIVIATPGRLICYVKTLDGFSLSRIEILVMDEADRILDPYFYEQMATIVSYCTSPYRQTMLFSATLTTEVKGIAVAALKDPVQLFVNSNKTVAKGLRQEYVLIRNGTSEFRNAVLVYLLTKVFTNNVLVFLPTKVLCHRLYVLLRLCGIRVAELHSKLPQSTRLHNMALFANGKLRVMLATDLAARGLDIKGVDTVINYKLNMSYEMYVHRVGRTARAGYDGLAVSILPKSEYKSIKEIKKNSNTPMFQRIVDMREVINWKEKITKLTEVVNEILKMESDELQAQAELAVKKRIDSLSLKNERKLKSLQTLAARKQDQKKEQSRSIKKIAEQQGLTETDYKLKKKLESSRVSNSCKKRLLRYKERMLSATCKVKKNALSKIDVKEAKLPVQFPVVFRKNGKKITIKPEIQINA